MDSEYDPLMAAPAIRTEGLAAGYNGTVAIEDVEITVTTGELAGLLGPNGSGKSTLVKALLGLLKPRAGRIEVLGGEPAAARGRVGYVPQAEQVDWNYPITAGEVVGMGLYRRSWFAGRFRRADPVKVTRALEAVAMTPFAGRQIRELSGGQQRRVLVARALVKEPELLLLDEPAAGLDVNAEESLLDLLVDLARAGRTLLVATHDIAGVRERFDRVICLDRRVVAQGPPAETLTDRVLHETFGRQLLVFDATHERHAVEAHSHHEDAP